ncbi:MAG: hypothetical protein H6585_02305 [Flavobacteriales bacterium]|nr:hypothetical protein [Flavobacteriales bacterium]MCB9447160.1 hypothetical protein [Flavobacteriales bacterium]
MKNLKTHLGISILFLLVFFALFYSFTQPAMYRNTMGKISQNYVNVDGERKMESMPFTHITNDNYVRWDGLFYRNIAHYGYNQEESTGEYSFAFFPLYPLLWKVLHLPSSAMLFVNYLLYVASLYLLLTIFPQEETYKNRLLLSFTLPSVVIFFIPYTEALSMFTTVVGLWGWKNKRNNIFFIGFLLASLTRPSYTFLALSIVCAELYFMPTHKSWLKMIRNMVFRLLPLLLGTAIVSFVHLLYGSGDPLKFVHVQKYWENILAVPHDLRDWSHEGFSINLGVVYMIFIPLLLLVITTSLKQVRRMWDGQAGQEVDVRHYLVVLSMIYLIGATLFVILFRAGSLHCLFRFTLCTPFAYVLLIGGFGYVRQVPEQFRLIILACVGLAAIFSLAVVPYSTYWDFSDLGLFILLAALFLWLFQDHAATRVYRIARTAVIAVNLVWTCYLFNAYLCDGWIFA